MANTAISEATAAAMLNAVTAALDGGPAAGYIEIRDGTQPADPNVAATGTLLATCTLSDPSFPAATAASPATMSANAISDDTNADASSTATWFRAYDSVGVAVIDGDVSTVAAGTGDLQLDDTAIVAGGTVSITGWTLNQPTA